MARRDESCAMVAGVAKRVVPPPTPNHVGSLGAGERVGGLESSAWVGTGKDNRVGGLGLWN